MDQFENTPSPTTGNNNQQTENGEIMDDGPSSHRIGFGNHSWLVHKFGGTSVANADCFRRVAAIVEDQMKLNESINFAIVVSAIGGKPKTTDLLLDTVRFAAERSQVAVEETLQIVLDKHNTCLAELFPNDQEEQSRLLCQIQNDVMDIRDILKTVSLMKWQAARISELVSGYGELWSTHILTSLLRLRIVERQALQKRDFGNSTLLDESEAVIETHEFVYLDARRVITVDEVAVQHGAIVWDVSHEKLKNVYKEERCKLDPSSTIHFITTGYVASNTEGVATTLQRDGSDYSAAIMGRLLSASSICIWTDVDGVLSADPRRVPLAQVLPEVSYNEAMELAYFGAKVIHPKTMQPAISAQPPIPIFIRNTFNPQFRGTRIYTRGNTSRVDRRDNKHVVCGLSSIEKMALINIEGSGLVGVPGIDRRIFATLERVHVNVVMISQGSSEHSVTFATTEESAKIAKDAIEEDFEREIKQNRISRVDVKAPCSIIAAVGDGMAKCTGVSGRFFSALGDAKINVLAIAQGSSERNISAVVNSGDSSRALRAVHAAFRLSHKTIRLAIVGMNDLGSSLVQLLDTQRASLRSTFEIDLQICAILSASDSSELVTLRRDDDSSAESITLGPYNHEMGVDKRETVFVDDRNIAQRVHGGLDEILLHLIRNECTNHVIFDCTNDEKVGRYHSKWLSAGVDVVTANNTGLSGPRPQRDALLLAQQIHGKDSAQYLREVTVGGGLPVISTLRSLLQSGDSIRRIDGILSVSLSFIMFRISPPANIAACSRFDEVSSKGAFVGDLALSTGVGEPCSFSQAVKEAISLGLMEADPTKDLNNEYTARVLMVLAMELGVARNMEVSHIQASSDKLLEMILDERVDYANLPSDLDLQIKERVDAARARGCVLRQIGSVDVRNKELSIQILEVPDHHVFAVTPPSCECVRFFTHRHKHYPLIVQGPSAGSDSTASALLAELLQLMRGKTSPISVSLSRTGSSAVLQQPHGTSISD